MNVIKIEPGCTPQRASVEEISVRALSEALGGGIEVWNMDPCGLHGGLPGQTERSRACR